MTRFKLVGVVVVLSILLTGFPPSSQTQAASESPLRSTQLPPTVLTPADVDISGYSPADLAWMAKESGTNLEGARQRARVETAVIGGFEQRVRNRWPKTFGGLWITRGPAAEVVVAFAESALNRSARHNDLRGLFAYPDRLQLKTVTRSLEELEALADRLSADRVQAQSGGIHPNLDIRRSADRFDIAVDVVANNVEVRVADARGSLSFASSGEAFRNYYKAPWLSVVSGLAQPGACSRENCQWTMRGGVTLRWSDRACSSAFGAQSGTNRFIISAAHCPGSVRRNGPNGHYGSVDRERQTGASDAERIRYTYTDRPWVTEGKFLVDNNTHEVRAVTHHLYHSAIPVGMTVGLSGSYSNFQRGYVIRKDIRPGFVSNARNFIQASYCAWEGDSGGSIFNSTRAAGIHSGHLWPPNYQTGDCGSFFGPAGEAKDALGVQYIAG